MKKTAIAVLASVCLVTGAYASGPLKLADDTYSLTAIAAEGGKVSARIRASRFARNFCKESDKKAVITDLQTATITMYGIGKATVTFRCVSPRSQEQANNN